MQTVTRAAPDTGAPRLIPGQRFGRYRVERLLGRGGMGEVYEAEDLESGRRLALKILLQSMADAADRDRLLREGRLAAAVSHPHTVYVYGTEQIEGVPTIAMELASGGTLKDKVRAGGALAPDDAVDAMLQVIAGLDAAARVDVLHRDIKPSNCFVGLDGTVKIGDFGLSISTLAHGETQLTLMGAVLGTPAFASPEQLRGQTLDGRCDALPPPDRPAAVRRCEPRHVDHAGR
jgi:serine/threonine protein kinase